jgi:hypothetical protein
MPYTSSSRELFLLEDDAGCRRHGQPSDVRKVSLHRVSGNTTTVIGTVERGSSPRNQFWKADAATSLLSKYQVPSANGTVIAGAAFGGNLTYVLSLSKLGYSYYTEVPLSTKAALTGYPSACTIMDVILSLDIQNWGTVKISHPITNLTVTYAVHSIGKFEYIDGVQSFLTLLQVGAIQGIHRGTIAVLSSKEVVDYENLINCVGWTRWVRPLERRKFCQRPRRSR